MDLFKATEHLGTARVELFGTLWTAVEDKGDYRGEFVAEVAQRLDAPGALD